MMTPVYYNKRIDEHADIYALVPVTMLSVVKTERRVTDDFIATAVKRFKKQDPQMGYIEIAEKLCQEGDLIKKIVEDIKDAERLAKDVAEGEERYRRAVSGKNEVNEGDGGIDAKNGGDIKTGAYVVFNHVTGVICRDVLMAKDVKELHVNGYEYYFHKSVKRYLALVCGHFGECRTLIDPRDGMLAPEVKRLLVDVEPDPEKGPYTVVDVYPAGIPFRAYMMVSVKWTRIGFGKEQKDNTITPDNWRIGSIRSNGRFDIGMRDKIMSDKNNLFVGFRNALSNRFDNINKEYREFAPNRDRSLIDEIDKKHNLKLSADLRQFIWERQIAITAAKMAATEKESRGVYEKCYGVLEHEIYGFLKRMSPEEKNKIKNRVDNMRDAEKKQAVENLFNDVGLIYKDTMYHYFAGVCGPKVYGMFFEEMQADFSTAIIALLIRYTMDKNYMPVERLKTEYPDFMVEFDVLDILNKRNKGKHAGQTFDTDGVVRFAGRMEKALYGVNIIEELGAVKSDAKPTAVTTDLGNEAAKSLGLNEDTELRRRFLRAYASFLNSDSSFYADCENVLVELYGGVLLGVSGQSDAAKRNEAVIERLAEAGFDKTKLDRMSMLKSGTDKGLLAQKFLDMVVAEKRFIRVLVENKQALWLADELYKDIGHSGRSFEVGRCAQYLELIETQIIDVSKFYNKG